MDDYWEVRVLVLGEVLAILEIGIHVNQYSALLDLLVLALWVRIRTSK